MTSSSEQTTALREDHSAVECVRDWLYDDNHGFVIPDTEWGRDIYSALREVLVTATPRVVTTVAELDALPRDSIIHVPGGSASARKTGDGLWSCDYGFHQGKVPSTTFLNQDGNLTGVVVLWVGGTE